MVKPVAMLARKPQGHVCWPGVQAHGRPSINPLYFVSPSGHIWLGTSEWTLAARNVKADPRVIEVTPLEAVFLGDQQLS